MTNDKHDARTYAIIGAAMEVHRELGCGFLEAVYQEALALELAARAIPSRREVLLPVHYKGTKLQAEYRADLVCFDNVIVEVKALSEFGAVHLAQVISYLKVTGFEIGLLLNFGTKSLQHKRIVLSSQEQNLRKSV